MGLLKAFIPLIVGAVIVGIVTWYIDIWLGALSAVICGIVGGTLSAKYTWE